MLTQEPALAELPLQASEPVREALARLGRSEDLRFSPDNSRLVLAGFSRHKLLVLAIRVTGGDHPGLEFTDFLELRAPDIGYVHGLDFIDARTLAVASRDGALTIVRIPEGELAGREVLAEPLARVRGRHVQNPGSVAVVPGAGGTTGLLVCNNYVHRVTRYDFDPAQDFAERGHELVARWGLNVPDGVAVSQDGLYIAISSHKTHDVKVYSAADPARDNRRPVAVLGGVRYAHGLRFTPDDRHLLVADAGAPVVRVYERGAGWSGAKQPARSVVVLDQEVFIRGHKNPEEGGPKGLDIDRAGAVVALTCEEKALSIFPLAAFTA